MQSGSITPILRIFDIELAQSFYLDFLGFQLDWQHQFEENFPLYLQISKDDCVIHLSEHFDDASPHSAIRIYWEHIYELHSELSQKDYKFSKPQIEKTDWETLELSITDPFSNRIIFWADA
ncbi:glyoxalase superfamily protein [Acinetobacter pittii]|uniref:glyoxalase superfamily protein n=1 Tax=Acinetobacter pittii TaxID=48296 RepID=UPI001EFCDFA8|nr:glyoxalase superfamily protein [Acinetobacter pittii]MCG9514055.1 glyoxalase superfamily protein [Acinetobacter pittii]